MKWLITIVAAVAVSLAVTAFADEPVFMAPPDTGYLFSENLPGPMPGVKIVAEKPLNDVGIELYASHIADLEAEGRGVAAGGKGAVTVLDEKTRIWEELLAPVPSTE